jgi:hypothetical protein
MGSLNDPARYDDAWKHLKEGLKMTKKKSPKRSPELSLPDPPADDAALTDWALWCAEVGRITGAWRVFPCSPGEKYPLHQGWQDEASSDRNVVDTMWRDDPDANIGLAIQPGFVAIDADIYKPDAKANLAAFEMEHGMLPRTLVSHTARGGYRKRLVTAWAHSPSSAMCAAMEG